jgi:hypothetical protein
MVFLLALATASTVSELHAIDVVSICFSAPSLGFLSKTQRPEDTQRALAEVTVKSLCETMDNRRSDDRKLCPIRTLRSYLEILHSAADIHLVVPGRQSSRRRRTITRLESEVRIRIPTDSADPKDSSLDQRVVSQSSSDHTSMDNQVLVRDGTRTSGGSTLATSTKRLKQPRSQAFCNNIQMLELHA